MWRSKTQRYDLFRSWYYKRSVIYDGVHYNCWDDLFKQYPNIHGELSAWSAFESFIDFSKVLELAKESDEPIEDVCSDYNGNIYRSSAQRDAHVKSETGMTDHEMRQKLWTQKTLAKNETMKNGVRAKITKYDIETGNIEVMFEDGTPYHGTHSAYNNGSIAHPTLRGQGYGHFCGFKTKKIDSIYDNGEWKAYYECECEKCGKISILTPQQMMEHAKTHV